MTTSEKTIRNIDIYSSFRNTSLSLWYVDNIRELPSIFTKESVTYL